MQELLGDYHGFFDKIRQQLQTQGIDITGMPVSHVAYRTASVEEYEIKRQQLLSYCSSEVENVWNGRPIAKLLLKEPLQLADDFAAPLIELIPTPHRGKYPMGLEHIGFVAGFAYDRFGEQHDKVLDGILENGPYCQPAYIVLGDGSTAKFYRYSLKDVVELEGRKFAAPRASAPAG